MQMHKKKLECNNSIELVSAILMAYPVINTVDINLDKRNLKINFLIDGKVTNGSWHQSIKKIKQQFRLFNKFNRSEEKKMIIKKNEYKELNRLTLIRSLVDLSKNELDFLVKVVEGSFEEQLLKNKNISPDIDCKYIDSLLKKLAIKKGNTELKIEYLGFIEDDKVLVFNRNRARL